MNTLQNLHTHSIFCDGADTPEELVLAALEKGFDAIGFSGHAYLPYSPSLARSGNRMADYIREVDRLKDVYRDRIRIYRGLEDDFYSEVDLSGYDYLIGSVHYLKLDGQVCGFDRSLAAVTAYVQDHFGGDGLQFAKTYFETVCHLPEKAQFDILGHFDILTKNNEAGKFIDTASPAYLSAGYEAIHALRGKIALFEVNTGAISRGYRTVPYPQMEFLKEFRACGYGAVITSDCHDKHFLDCHFTEAAQLLQAAGFASKWILTDDGFREVAL